MENLPATRAVFAQQIERYEKAIRETEARLIRISWLRLALFVGGGALEVWSWNWGGIWWLAVLAAGLLGFGGLVRWYLRVEREKRYQLALRDINREELDRLDHRLDLLDGGDEFADREHPYSSDLDLYGPNSLFSYLSRATTGYGRRALAAWLNGAASREVILDRQEASAELAEKLDWRQELQATGRMFEDPGEDPEKLRAWMNAPALLLSRPVYRWIPILLPSIAMGLIIAAFAGWLPFYLAPAWVAVQVLINRSISRYSEKVFKETSDRARVLQAYAELIGRIEAGEMRSGALRELQSRLKTGGAPAHAEIARLANILMKLETRLNGLPYLILNHLFFWDMIWIRRQEAWRQRHGQAIMDWFRVIGEMEAFCSLAALEFARPDWARPEIPEQGYCLEGEALGHPLLPAEECVVNPVSLGRRGLIWLITGSNMSGKSTYLRTVGINAVLALTGARACARSFRITPMQVLTSMRTLDSLEENTSSFYAELKRLKMVIGRVESGEPVVFMLDEILKGTNSRDRHAGARALIRQLQARGGSGLVSTHDLDLVQLADELPGDVLNYSFNCEVTPTGGLHFDYSLTAGICHSMNATQLMKAMGIQM